jgi:hypothetical protein
MMVYKCKVIVEMWKAHVRLIHAYPFVPQPSMDIIKREPHSDSESNPSSPLSEDVIPAKLQGLPVAVINSGASVSYFFVFFVRVSFHSFDLQLKILNFLTTDPLQI